jgi:coniferyl-aldehyde dehydrogenase
MDLQQLFNAQQTAYQQHPHPTYQQRLTLLNTLQALIKNNIDSLCQAVSHDFQGRSFYETKFAEIFPMLQEIRYAKKHLKKWLRSKRVGLSVWFKPAYGKIIKQPLGVVGIVAPWNYPLLLAISPLTTALAAGNRVMVKNSEAVPQTGALLAKLFKKYFSEDQIAMINGDVSVAQAFTQLPFNHLLYTGSTNVGKLVMRAASDNLTPVTLELGGKSPTIIGPDANLDKTSQKIMLGKLINAGQTCIAPDYIFAPKDKINEFIQQSKKYVAQFYPNLKTTADYTCLINEKRKQDLLTLFQDAKEQGADIIPLSEHQDIELTINKLAPIAILNATDNMKVCQQEIFGPLLPIIPYQKIEEVISYINTRPRPLALYYFGHNKQTINKLLLQTHAGGVCINETILHAGCSELPFGGIGASGMGHYHGEAGFNTFSKQKSVFIQRRFDLTKMMLPPYGKMTDWLLKLMLR